jgi:hypothetical protein
MRDFLKRFALKGDGTGFWDEYRKQDHWLGEIIEIAIAARSVSEDISLLLERMMENQTMWDRRFKEFAARALLEALKREWKNKNLDEAAIISSLRVSLIAFGWEADSAFAVWFCTPGEHGVAVYGDKQGNLIRAGVE